MAELTGTLQPVGIGVRQRSTGQRQSLDWLWVVEEADRGTSVRASPRNGADSIGGRERVVETPRGRLVNVVAVIEQDTWTKESWTEPGNVADLLAAYHHWHPQVRAILQTFEVTFRWAIFERSPMPRWSSGRVTLLGDACHAMLPFLAQGAAQAMEDGVTLATLLSNLDSRAAVPDALRVYESVRRPRVTRVQHMASDNKTRLNMPDGPGQRARDAELAKGTTDIFFSAWEWLYQYNPEAALRSTHRTDLHRNRNRDPA